MNNTVDFEIKRIRVLNLNPIYDYRESCKITQGIELPEVVRGLDVDDECKWWVRQIVANHSTLRCVKFRYTAIAPKSVIMQIIRATKGHPQPEVQSSRPDWTGEERSKDPYELKLFAQDHTAESFVEMTKQRLCKRTEENTRLFMQALVERMKESDSPFIRAVGLCAHPACWWYKSCPELKPCTKGVRRLSDEVLCD